MRHDAAARSFADAFVAATGAGGITAELGWHIIDYFSSRAEDLAGSDGDAAVAQLLRRVRRRASRVVVLAEDGLLTKAHFVALRDELVAISEKARLGPTRIC